MEALRLLSQCEPESQEGIKLQDDLDKVKKIINEFIVKGILIKISVFSAPLRRTC
jgi:hypothetical protein